MVPLIQVEIRNFPNKGSWIDHMKQTKKLSKSNDPLLIVNWWSTEMTDQVTGLNIWRERFAKPMMHSIESFVPTTQTQAQQDFCI